MGVLPSAAFPDRCGNPFPDSQPPGSGDQAEGVVRAARVRPGLVLSIPRRRLPGRVLASLPPRLRRRRRSRDRRKGRQRRLSRACAQYESRVIDESSSQGRPAQAWTLSDRSAVDSQVVIEGSFVKFGLGAGGLSFRESTQASGNILTYSYLVT